MGSQTKYNKQELRYVLITFEPVGDPPVTPDTLNYGFFTNVPTSYGTVLGHVAVANKSAIPNKFVLGASSPKPRRAGKRETNRYVSTFVSKDKIDDAKKAGYRVTRSKVRNNYTTGANSLVKTVYVNVKGVKYAWNIPKVTAQNAVNLSDLGVIDATPNDRDELVFGAEFPKPPTAEKKILGADAKTISTFYDPDKTAATGWILNDDGAYDPMGLNI